MTRESEFLLATLQGTGASPPQAIDWQMLLELADRHGVLPMFCRNMAGELPDAFESLLRSRWIASAALASELEGLLREFSQRGLEVLPLKGPPLAQTLYGSPTLRPSDDLDLLVRPQDFVRSQSLLIDVGFEPEDVADDYHQAFHRGNTKVELHFAVAPLSSPAMDLESAWGRAGSADFRGQRLRVFAKPDLLLYLVIHGVKHEFSRLIWILDAARVLADLDEHELDQAVRMSRAIGMEGALLTTCVLARLSVLAELPGPISSAIARKPVISAEAVKIWEKTMAGNANPQTTHQGARLFIQLEPGARSRWGQRLRLFRPSQQDHLWAQRHRIHARWMPFLRPLRLLSKYGPGSAWRVLFPASTPGAADPDFDGTVKPI
jgi:hypothetical protein